MESRMRIEKSVGTKMNELDLCLKGVLRSCQPLHHIRHCISRKPLEIESWFQLPKDDQ